MEQIIFNAISAVAIGAIIAIMASLKSNKARALLYSLPIPMTIALVATGGVVNTTHILGLVLVTLFLWGVAFLHARGVPIVISDTITTVAYLAVGYVAITFITVPFYVTVLCAIIAWILFVYAYRHRVVKDMPKKDTRIAPLIKLPIVSVFAYGLLSLKSVFAGIIVTFPFSGVFAVIENRHMLERLAATFTRNSIAIVGFFVTIHALGDMNVFVKIAVGWGVYLVILRLVLWHASRTKRLYLS